MQKVNRCDNHRKRPQKADGKERAEVTGLQFKDARDETSGSAWRRIEASYQNPSDVSIVFWSTFEARSSSKWWKARLNNLITFFPWTPDTSFSRVSAVEAFVASTLCGM